MLTLYRGQLIVTSLMRLNSIVFDVFSRVDKSRNQETGGFGLGLAIVSRIMEWHQGSVDVIDSELGGACFVLRWPLKQ
jgi:two-component system, OmpR family, sensor kinase